jgi:hypothetical protein
MTGEKIQVLWQEEGSPPLWYNAEVLKVNVSRASQMFLDTS